MSDGEHRGERRRQSMYHRVDSAAIQNETYCIELLNRATLQVNQDAWKIIQMLFGETVRGWITQHPRREEACNLDSEETYVTQAFARFYLLTVPHKVEFSQLSTALQYLKVCLNGAILARLRAFSRPRAFPLPIPDDLGEIAVAHATHIINVWNILRELFPSVREQRLAYLLFQCNLSPKDIVISYPQEFTDVREISHLRHSIFEQLLHWADHFDEWRHTVRGVNITAESSEGLGGKGEK